MNVGAQLARARQGLGLSLEEVSAKTKVSVERLSAIEQMDAERLPSLIYLRGFLRAYATEVHLNPDDVAERYIAEMDVVVPVDLASQAFLNEQTPPPVVRRPHAAVPEFQALAAADPDFFVSEEQANHFPPIDEGRQVVEEKRRFGEPAAPAVSATSIGPPSESRAVPEPRDAREIPTRVQPPPAATPEPPVPSGLPLRADPPFPADRPLRDESPSYADAPFTYEPPVRDDAPIAVEPPVHAAAPLGAEPPLPGEAARPSESHAPILQEPLASRTRQPRYFTAYVGPDAPPQPPPRRASARYAAMMLALALSVLAGWVIGENYESIRERVAATSATGGEREREDSPAAAANEESAPPRDHRQDEPAVAALPPTNVPSPTFDESPAPSTETAERTSSAPERGSTPAIRAPEPAPDAARAVEGDSRVVQSDDLSGRWTLTNRIEESSYTPYKGMNVGFQLQLRQEGNRVTGTGQKWMENGRPLPPSRRTPIAIEGTVSGGRLTLNFTERGARRASAGTFSLDVTDDSTLSGTFASDAANAQGTSLARRTEAPRR